MNAERGENCMEAGRILTEASITFTNKDRASQYRLLESPRMVLRGVLDNTANESVVITARKAEIVLIGTL